MKRRTQPASILRAMVRRDEARPTGPRGPEQVASRCTSPAGASPVPESVGAPGSRLPTSRRERGVEAQRQEPDPRREPCGGEQARGPQHEVKPAASTEKQSEGRAAHVTAKATPVARESECAAGLGGVWGAARVQGEVGNTRGPSARPTSGKSAPYKSKTKSAAVQRESEGIVVPGIAVTKNAAGGKGPCFGHAGEEGTREGMAAKSGPNNPVVRSDDVQVQQPRRLLWVLAKLGWAEYSKASISTRSDDRVRASGSKSSIHVQAAPRRPSVSRMPEIGTYGLKGGSAHSPMTTITV